MTLPKLVQRDGSQWPVAPFLQANSDLYCHLLRADRARLQARVDETLNLGGNPTVYRVVAPFVILYFSRGDVSAIPNTQGWSREKDFGFWVPICAGRYDDDGRYRIERLLIFTPYLWVDNQLSFVGGREIFGFPKQLGRLAMPGVASGESRFQISTTVMPTFASQTQAVERVLVDCHRTDTAAWQPMKSLWQGIEQIVGALASELEQHWQGETSEGAAQGGEWPTWPLLKDLLFLAKGGTSMAFLKQLPDVADGARACYQAVTETDLQIQGEVKGAFLPGTWAIDIWQYASHNIVSQLGLAAVAQPRTTVTPLFGWWLHFDFIVKPGRVVWQIV